MSENNSQNDIKPTIEQEDEDSNSNNNNNFNNNRTTTTTTTTTSSGNNNNDNNNGSEQSSSPPPPQQQQSSPFECNICFDDVSEPVVTQCGHLFCWTCIFQWLQHNSSQQCPVCKAPITKEKLIPIYGRGGSGEDPRKKSQSIPQRPPGRPEQARPRGRGDYTGGGGGFNDFFNSPFGSGVNGNIGNSGVSFSAGFGLFPGLFGIHFYGNNNNNNNNNSNNNSNSSNSNSSNSNSNNRNSMTSEESIFVSRLMFALGLLLLFFVLFN
ncbi:hypothetical protein ACTFIU_007881 [Dictyostelium citrinum]